MSLNKHVLFFLGDVTCLFSLFSTNTKRHSVLDPQVLKKSYLLIHQLQMCPSPWFGLCRSTDLTWCFCTDSTALAQCCVCVRVHTLMCICVQVHVCAYVHLLSLKSCFGKTKGFIPEQVYRVV